MYVISEFNLHTQSKVSPSSRAAAQVASKVVFSSAKMHHDRIYKEGRHSDSAVVNLCVTRNAGVTSPYACKY